MRRDAVNEMGVSEAGSSQQRPVVRFCLPLRPRSRSDGFKRRSLPSGRWRLALAAGRLPWTPLINHHPTLCLGWAQQERCRFLKDRSGLPRASPNYCTPVYNSEAGVTRHLRDPLRIVVGHVSTQLVSCRSGLQHRTAP